nr:hypothetical protein Iba_chr14dCG6800 [Ipomoea batatas]
MSIRSGSADAGRVTLPPVSKEGSPTAEYEEQYNWIPILRHGHWNPNLPLAHKNSTPHWNPTHSNLPLRHKNSTPHRNPTHSHLPLRHKISTPHRNPTLRLGHWNPNLPLGYKNSTPQHDHWNHTLRYDHWNPTSEHCCQWNPTLGHHGHWNSIPRYDHYQNLAPWMLILDEDYHFTGCECDRTWHDADRDGGGGNGREKLLYRRMPSFLMMILPSSSSASGCGVRGVNSGFAGGGEDGNFSGWFLFCDGGVSSSPTGAPPGGFFRDRAPHRDQTTAIVAAMQAIRNVRDSATGCFL